MNNDIYDIPEIKKLVSVITSAAKKETLKKAVFSKPSDRSIVKAGEIENGIPVIGGKQQTVRGSVSKELSSFCNKRAEEFKPEIRYEYFGVKAPVKIDDVIGKVVVVLQNGEELCSEIVSLDDVEALSYYDCVKNLIKSW